MRENQLPDLAISDEIVWQVVDLLGEGGLFGDELDSRVAALIADPVIACRLTYIIPEAFGLVLAAHVKGKINLPTSFCVKDKDGKWQEFPFTKEPLFAMAGQMAADMYHSGPREKFKNVSSRSATVSCINNLLSNGGKLDGSTLSANCFHGVPAEIYGTPRQSFGAKMASWLYRR